ncbi:MAG: LPS-assembly protein LptD [Magnetococcales bacterium]|nr:LPS-assembly protein LptD [Magnetococcales bacterium]
MTLPSIRKSTRIDSSTDQYRSIWSHAGITVSALTLGFFLAIPVEAGGRIPVNVEADSLVHDPDNYRITASGNVRISHGDVLEMKADKSEYRTLEHAISASGNVELRYKEDRLTGDRLDMNLIEESGLLENVSLELSRKKGHAEAKSIEIHDRNHATMHEARFTSCDCEIPPWWLSAGKLDVDYEENRLTARNLTLKLKDVPIAYLPWWRYPLKKTRESGFLTPRLQASDASGFEVDVPYYWNISPQRDATITLHPTTERGMMLKFQYRYLGANYQGMLETHDMLDSKEDTYRGLKYVDHRHQLGNWRLQAHVESTQTRDFINDFHQDLLDENSRNLESYLFTDRIWNRTNGFSNLEIGTRWNQDLESNTNELTVQRLPYVTLLDHRPLNWLGDNWRLETQAQLDNFYQLAGNHSRRIHIAPSVNYRHPLHFGSFSAKAGIQETAYWVQSDPLAAGNTNVEDFSQRIASTIDLRLNGYLEKTYQSDSDKSWYHVLKNTIEPTLQYVVNTAHGEDETPNFDATLEEISVHNLFSDNLYLGVDRMSRGHWLALGITSRLIGRLKPTDPVREIAAFSIGQRWAPEGSREYQNDNAMSDLVAGLRTHLSKRLSASASARFDPYLEEMRTVDSLATYAHTKTDKYSMGYRLKRADVGAVSQADTEDLLWRSENMLYGDWRWNLHLDYSLEEEDVKTWQSGLSYIHDCWSFEFTGGRRLSSDSSRHNGAWIGFMISFKGLGGYRFTP